MNGGRARASNKGGVVKSVPSTVDGKQEEFELLVSKLGQGSVSAAPYLREPDDCIVGGVEPLICKIPQVRVRAIDGIEKCAKDAGDRLGRPRDSGRPGCRHENPVHQEAALRVVVNVTIREVSPRGRDIIMCDGKGHVSATKDESHIVKDSQKDTTDGAPELGSVCSHCWVAADRE